VPAGSGHRSPIDASGSPAHGAGPELFETAKSSLDGVQDERSATVAGSGEEAVPWRTPASSI
jgi:hypothetical protein